MSSSSQPLTSTASDLFQYLKQINREKNDAEPEIVIPPTQLDRSVSGKYKFEVHDDSGLVYDSGDWKPNLILNCGLDKVAEMPWAQVFQFAVAGTDPTPTRELYEDTDLTVELLSTNKCPPPTTEGTMCNRTRSSGGLIARACTSNREAVDASPLGNCLQKTFGESSDSGKLLYLRDRDLQYNVLTSCPVYAYDPVLPEAYIAADECGSLSAAQIPGGNPGGMGGLTLNGGAGYMASLSADTGAPWNEGGLIMKHQNFDLPPGDCTAPVLCTYDSTHMLPGETYVNPVVGISIDPPSLASPMINVHVNADGDSILPGDIDILDPGEALGCKDLTLQFGLPQDPTRCRGPWYNKTSPAFNNHGRHANCSHYVDWVHGRSDIYNIVRLGAFWGTGREAASLEAPNDITSYEEFFSKMVVHSLFRKQWDTATPFGNEQEYNKLSVDFRSVSSNIPGASIPTGGNRCDIMRNAGFDSASHVQQNIPGFSPWHWLPWWSKKGKTAVNNTTNAGGKDYLDEFNNPFATFAQNVLLADGPFNVGGLPVDPRGKRAGNLFSGIPFGKLNGLPKYTYVLGPADTDFGSGIKAVDSSNVTIFGGLTYIGADPTKSHPENTVIPHYHAPGYGGVSSQFPPGPNGGEFMVFNIVNGKAVSITFDWQVYYDWLTHPNQQGSHIKNVTSDISMILGLRFHLPTITYEATAPAKGKAILTDGKVTSVDLISGGYGYCPHENVNVAAITPPTRQAVVSAGTSSINGAVTAIHVLDYGAGYSTLKPARICFPPVPEPDILSYDLLVDPVNTYESINNGHYHEKIKLPSPCQKTDIFNTNQTELFRQYKTHGWYLTGNHPETNATYCGSDFLSAANQVAMTRTYDFYMELQPVTYTEIGFKESPAARELFSRIVLDHPIRLCPGQFLRLAYQLIVTWEPGNVPRYKSIPTAKEWHNARDPVTFEYLLTGYECIQGNGMCIVDQSGIAIPYDITGCANEPYAPGSINLGPQYGYVNRWYNGDTRLSYPTKEYATISENPWVLGGDQVNPPDWAIKAKDSPTVNYKPRDFKSYVEWPAMMAEIPDVSNTSPTIKFKTVEVPAGPELPIERDAFDHWFTKAPPTAKNTVTFTNFVPNRGGGAGRWDFITTKAYLADVYPQLMGSSSVYQNVRDDDWILKYRDGEYLPKNTPAAMSFPGVFPGPVIQYTGSPGSLHDPVRVKDGRSTRNVSDIRNPYGKYDIMFLEPNNTGAGSPMLTITYTYCQGGVLTFTSDEFCWKKMDPLKGNVVNNGGTFGLAERQQYHDYGSVDSKTALPVDPKAGSGFTMIDSWSPWTHTPLITSLELASLIGKEERRRLCPDTAGNWTEVEAIPVAGGSAFVSTSNEAFASYGSWRNRSHTLSGAVSGKGAPVHDFSGVKSFETPLLIDAYSPGDHSVTKRAVFETSFANLTGVHCIGVGPTSTTITPIDMTDSARFNTYVFKFGDVDSDPTVKGFDNMTTYKLSVAFKHAWYRNLKI